MIAWVALGLGVVVAAGLMYAEIQRRRITVTARPEPIQVPYDQDERPAGTITEEQRRELASAWPYVACTFCGELHGGICRRVREVRYLPSGGFERVIFWHQDQWVSPPGAITAWDVFGLVVPTPQQAPEPEEVGA